MCWRWYTILQYRHGRSSLGGSFLGQVGKPPRATATQPLLDESLVTDDQDALVWHRTFVQFSMDLLCRKGVMRYGIARSDKGMLQAQGCTENDITLRCFEIVTRHGQAINNI